MNDVDLAQSNTLFVKFVPKDVEGIRERYPRKHHLVLEVELDSHYERNSYADRFSVRRYRWIGIKFPPRR